MCVEHLFLCMSPSMEFLVADVTTRSLLMSFVKDNYGLVGMARDGMKSWLCVPCVDIVTPGVTPGSSYTLWVNYTIHGINRHLPKSMGLYSILLGDVHWVH